MAKASHPKKPQPPLIVAFGSKDDKKLDNTVLCPEDVVRVLLPAAMIPHDATVSKRTGEYTFVLKHKLTMYGIPPNGSKTPAPPTIVDGFFVVGERGTINQVKPDTWLHWHVTVEDFMEILNRSWGEQASQ